MIKNVGVILAAGSSQRFNSSFHKQYLKLNGKEVVYYSIDAMKQSDCFDLIIVVVDKDEYDSGYISNKYNVTCIQGGKTRNHSIKCAIDFIADYPTVDKVVFHDSSRPFIAAEDFKETISLLDKYDAVATTSTITDGLITIDGQEGQRNRYNLVRTPEGARFVYLKQYFKETSGCITIIGQMRNCHCYMHVVNKFNFKLTYPQDLFLAEQLERISYDSAKNIQPEITGKVLLLGGSGGLGQALSQYFQKNNIEYISPPHKVLDLNNLTIEKIRNCMPFDPDIIINCAAAYANDDVDILSSFELMMNVNVKSNLVLMQYAESLKKEVHIVLLSSSSSTKGRAHLTNYSASKAALNSVIESQSERLSEKQIYINAIVPEKIDTPLLQKLHKHPINPRELLNTADVLPVILKYCSGSQSGKLIHVRKGL